MTTEIKNNIKKVSWYDYYQLCKPRVVALMLLTSLAGMFLATPNAVPIDILFWGTLGIALCAGSAATINQLVDRRIDILMTRTSHRPIATGRIPPLGACGFAMIIGIAGLLILSLFVNHLSAWLTFCSLIGYAFFYTIILKRATPQNIVIGGAAGAAPPLLGWACVTGDVSPYALLLVLIIFTWTPPHFWALAIYRREEYAKADIPMLPVTHGVKFTKLCILLYTLLLVAITAFPYITGMSGLIYFSSAMVLGIIFISYAVRLFRAQHEDKIARATFSYSIYYLMMLFIALLIDHYFIWH